MFIALVTSDWKQLLRGNCLFVGERYRATLLAAPCLGPPWWGNEAHSLQGAANEQNNVCKTEKKQHVKRRGDSRKKSYEGHKVTKYGTAWQNYWGRRGGAKAGFNVRLAHVRCIVDHPVTLFAATSPGRCMYVKPSLLHGK